MKFFDYCLNFFYLGSIFFHLTKSRIKTISTRRYVRVGSVKNLHHKRGVGQGKMRIAGVLLSLAATGEAALEPRFYCGDNTLDARQQFTEAFPQTQRYTITQDKLLRLA